MSPIVVSVRHLIQKYETQTRQSGAIGFSLRAAGEAGAQLRASLQETEHAMRLSKSKWDVVRVAMLAARESLETVRDRLEALFEGVVFICEANGPSEARTVLEADNGDSAAISQNLAQLVRHVPQVGPPLAKWVADLGGEFVATEAAFKAANAEFEQVSRDFAAALLKSASVVVQARALLVALGHPAPSRKPRAKKKAAAAPSAPPAAAPMAG